MLDSNNKFVHKPQRLLAMFGQLVQGSGLSTALTFFPLSKPMEMMVHVYTQLTQTHVAKQGKVFLKQDKKGLVKMIRNIMQNSRES